VSFNHDEDLPRRAFFARAIGGAIGFCLSGPLARGVSHGQKRDAGSRVEQPLVVRVSRPLDAETPLEAFSSWLTSNPRFFVRSHFGPPASDLMQESVWRLRVQGLVDRPLTLSVGDLRQFEEVTVTAVLQCSGNGRAFYEPHAPGVQWERGAVGNARWTGVRLRDVLQRAGIKPSARHVQMQGADRPVSERTPQFVRSIPLAKALHCDTLLATRMNDEPLPLLHGAPLRLITPGWMAESCMKWLTDLTVQEDEAQGYYMETAYRYPSEPIVPDKPAEKTRMLPVETMVVKSVIVQPTDEMVVRRGPVIIGGVAWTGEGRIARVDVSTNEGRTWQEAELLSEDVPYAWCQWRFLWQAKEAGPHTIVSQATDDGGHVQPPTSPWNPGGFLWNGMDRVRVRVDT
jgi:DMSO/TMAO reductase YedYZ molybdopterin-dependent catalytic subunit